MIDVLDDVHGVSPYWPDQLTMRVVDTYRDPVSWLRFWMRRTRCAIQLQVARIFPSAPIRSEACYLAKRGDI